MRLRLAQQALAIDRYPSHAVVRQFPPAVVDRNANQALQTAGTGAEAEGVVDGPSTQPVSTSSVTLAKLTGTPRYSVSVLTVKVFPEPVGPRRRICCVPMSSPSRSRSAWET